MSDHFLFASIEQAHGNRSVESVQGPVCVGISVPIVLHLLRTIVRRLRAASDSDRLGSVIVIIDTITVRGSVQKSRWSRSDGHRKTRTLTCNFSHNLRTQWQLNSGVKVRNDGGLTGLIY